MLIGVGVNEDCDEKILFLEGEILSFELSPHCICYPEGSLEVLFFEFSKIMMTSIKEIELSYSDLTIFSLFFEAY